MKRNDHQYDPVSLKAFQGWRREWTDLLLSHYALVHSIVGHFSRSEADVSGLVGQVFAKARRRIPLTSSPSTIPGKLATLARNHVLEERRCTHRLRRLGHLAAQRGLIVGSSDGGS